MTSRGCALFATASVVVMTLTAACAGDPPRTFVDPSEVPWETIGFGVAHQEIPDSSGEDALVVYGGYTAQLEWTQAWAQELFRARHRDRGVRHIYAVQGPADVDYRGLEIQNSRLAGHLVPLASSMDHIIVVAHSSGAFVAHELLWQLTEGGADPDGATAGRIAYYDLDGGASGLGAPQTAHLQSLVFVYAVDGETRSPNADAMIEAAAEHTGSTAVEIDASGSGCDAGAEWCVHDTVVIDRPHDPTTYDLRRDYQEFDADHRVVTAYFD